MAGLQLARLQDDMMMEEDEVVAVNQLRQAAPPAQEQEHGQAEAGSAAAAQPANGASSPSIAVEEGLGNNSTNSSGDNSNSPAGGKRGLPPTAATCPPPAPRPASPTPTQTGAHNTAGQETSMQQPPPPQAHVLHAGAAAAGDQQLCPGMEQIRAAAVATAAALKESNESAPSMDSNVQLPQQAAAQAVPAPGLQVESQPQQNMFSPQTSVVSPRLLPDGASVAGAQHRLLQGLAAEAQQPNGSVDGDNFGSHQSMQPSTRTPAQTPSMTPKMVRMQAGVRGLFGFEVKSLPQEGAYEYTHTATGMRFQLCPASDDASQDSELQGCLGGDAAGGSSNGSSGPGLRLVDFHPLCLGQAKLPAFMRTTFQFEEGGKQAFMNQLWDALTQL